MKLMKVLLRRNNLKKVSTSPMNEKKTISSNDERKAEKPQQIEAKKNAKIEGGLKCEGIFFLSNHLTASDASTIRYHNTA